MTDLVRRVPGAAVWLVGLCLAALALAACGPDGDDPESGPPAEKPSPSATPARHVVTPLEPLRAGERRLTLSMPAAYTPSAPNGVGTDDYRCFLLDPKLAKDVFLTGTSVQPGNSDVVHHVILFRVPPEQVAHAEQIDAQTPGQGWTCFGNSGLDSAGRLDDAPWLGAWAPGGHESVFAKGLGVPLAKGSRIVMQVHYNLLVADTPDVSATQLRVAPGSADLSAVETMLLPAPVELPCRAGHRDAPLCDRATALADVKQRFGPAGATADLLHFLCGPVKPGEVQTCERTITRPTTVIGVAGHMHLLGRSIKIEVNPGTPAARTLLRIPVWNFDDQGATPVKPVKLHMFDKVRVTCHHEQWLRDKLPAFDGQPDRYVVWGEGSTDEMCLGILQVVRD
ncbi:MAG TPA: hypothetical protein VGJ41_00645 [Nocardioides sp.]|jgi:hypothetical protein